MLSPSLALRLAIAQPKRRPTTTADSIAKPDREVHYIPPDDYCDSHEEVKCGHGFMNIRLMPQQDSQGRGSRDSCSWELPVRHRLGLQSPNGRTRMPEATAVRAGCGMQHIRVI